MIHKNARSLDCEVTNSQVTTLGDGGSLYLVLFDVERGNRSRICPSPILHTLDVNVYYLYNKRLSYVQHNKTWIYNRINLEISSHVNAADRVTQSFQCNQHKILLYRLNDDSMTVRQFNDHSDGDKYQNYSGPRMDLPSNFLTFLSDLKCAVSKSQFVALNENLENLWNLSPQEQAIDNQRQVEEDVAAVDKNTLIAVTQHLISTLCGILKDGTAFGHQSQDSITTTSQPIDVLNAWNQHHESLCLDDTEEPFLWFTEIIRASKNWVRWILQIYPMIAPSNSVSYQATQPFQSNEMLEFYMLLMDGYISLKFVNAKTGENLARHACQLLFYAVYSQSPRTDDKAQLRFQHLRELDFFDRILTMLGQAQTTAFGFALVQLIHNVMYSFTDASKAWTESNIFLTATACSKCPWLSQKSSEHYTFPIMLEYMLIWCLSSQPPLPNNFEDHRVNIVVEVLRTFYAVRAGSKLTVDSALANILVQLLHLDSQKKQCMDCQIAAVPILMDANPSLGDFLVSRESVAPLMHILDSQMTLVLRSNEMDNAGAAKLTPILAVLFRFSQANLKFRQLVKASIFPRDRETTFQAMVKEAEKGIGSTKNMTPMDAPSGTLRAGLIRLLSWPQSHIKRFVGELLWILCANDSKEFSYRVGMGNALPFLGLKGIVELPPTIHF